MAGRCSEIFSVTRKCGSWLHDFRRGGFIHIYTISFKYSHGNKKLGFAKTKIDRTSNSLCFNYILKPVFGLTFKSPFPVKKKSALSHCHTTSCFPRLPGHCPLLMPNMEKHFSLSSSLIKTWSHQPELLRWDYQEICIFPVFIDDVTIVVSMKYNNTQTFIFKMISPCLSSHLFSSVCKYTYIMCLLCTQPFFSGLDLLPGEQQKTRLKWQSKGCCFFTIVAKMLQSRDSFKWKANNFWW